MILLMSNIVVDFRPVHYAKSHYSQENLIRFNAQALSLQMLLLLRNCTALLATYANFKFPLFQVYVNVD